MAELNYAELYKAAIAESGTGSALLPKGTYNVKIANVKPDTAKGSGKFKVGICLQVLDGPEAGTRTWVNQTFSPESPKALAVFLRVLRDYGVPSDAINAFLPPEELIKYVVVGSEGVAEFDSHAYGTNDDGSPRLHQDCKKFTLKAGTPQAAGLPVPQPAPAPVTQPAPAAEVPGVPEFRTPPAASSDPF